MQTSLIKFPKSPKRKKLHHHAESILQKKDGRCWLCMRLHGDHGQKYLQKHHVYFGSGLREISEANGFTVYLCPEHHTDGPEAVHRNAQISREVQRAMQRKYEETHSRQDFMALVGRNYM
jgi:hypothetical protein